MQHQEAHQNVWTNMKHQKQVMPKYVANYITPNRDVDHLLIKHQIDMEECVNVITTSKLITCQQEQEPEKVSITSMLPLSITPTSNHQQKEQEQLPQPCLTGLKNKNKSTKRKTKKSVKQCHSRI